MESVPDKASEFWCYTTPFVLVASLFYSCHRCLPKLWRVLPETYNGEDGWDDWIENIASVNSWNDEAKLKWIKVCLAGRAQKALQGLPEESRGSYDNVKIALTQQFKPASKRELYNAELQV